MNRKTGFTIIGIIAVSVLVLATIDQVDFVKKTGPGAVEKPADNGHGIDMVSTQKTAYLTLYSLPKGSAPNSILADDNGMVWVTSSKFKTLYRINPVDNTIREYHSQQVDLGHMSWSMVQDNAGFIWFSQFGTDPLVRFDPSNGNFVAFHTKNSPFQMKYDTKNDDIWFTTLYGTLGLVQKINAGYDTNSYKIDEFPIGNNMQSSGLSLDKGSIWVTDLKGEVIKFNPVYASDGAIINITKSLEVPQGNMSLFSLPTDILHGRNDTVWITEHGPSTLTSFNMQTQEAIRFPTAKSSFHVATLPFWLRPSLDGKGIWFNEHEGGSVAFFTNNMTLLEYHVPVKSPDSISLMLNLSPDPGNPDKLWFSLWSLDEIGVVDKSVGIPFEIKAGKDLVQLTDSPRKTIPLEISKSKEGILQNGVLYLNASGSYDSSAELVNMSSEFSQKSIDLSNTTSPIHVDLSLKGQPQKRDYTIGISIGNSLVTRTIFAHVNAG